MISSSTTTANSSETSGHASTAQAQGKSHRCAGDRSTQTNWRRATESRQSKADNADDGDLFQTLINTPLNLTALDPGYLNNFQTDNFSADTADVTDLDRGGFTFTQAPLNKLLGSGDTLLTNLLDEVADSTQDGDFKCSLFLPHLGEVAVSGSQTANKWRLQFEFVNPKSFEYCRKEQPRMKKALAGALGKTIELELRLRRWGTPK
ncbi:MAG: hypothetical protein P8Y45_10790 [Exilibacterium sp.]